MALTNDQITAQNFKDFYTQILPYLNGGNYVEKSVTEGLLKNDGTVDTTTYASEAGTESLFNSTVGWMGKNLLPSTAVTQSLYGVTFTVNADKSITLENSSTGNFAYVVYEGSITVPANCVFSIGAIRHASTQIQVLIDGTSYYIPADKEYVEIPAGTLTRCRIDGNQYFSTDTPITYYPMVYDKRITDSTYEPYHQSVEAALATKNTVFIWDTTYTSASASDIDITLSEMPFFNVGDLLVLKVNANLTFNGNASYGWGFSFTVGGSSYAWIGNVKRVSSYTGYSTKAFTDNLSKGVCLTFVCTAVSNNIPDLLLISKESAETMSTTATLSTSAQTTVTFTRADLTTDSDVEVGISEWGLVPDDVTLSSGSCTVTLPIVDSAHTVTVRLYVR